MLGIHLPIPRLVALATTALLLGQSVCAQAAAAASADKKSPADELALQSIGPRAKVAEPMLKWLAPRRPHVRRLVQSLPR